MKLELVELIKEHIGYKDASQQCSGCRFFKEVPDTHTERMWNPVCTLIANTLGFMPVERDGCCNSFSTK